MLYGGYVIALFLLVIVPASGRVRLIKDARAAGRFTSAALKILFALAGLTLARRFRPRVQLAKVDRA